MRKTILTLIALVPAIAAAAPKTPVSKEYVDEAMSAEVSARDGAIATAAGTLSGQISAVDAKTGLASATYTAATRTFAIVDNAGNTSSVILPEASSAYDGLMAAADVDSLAVALSDIASLKGQTSRRTTSIALDGTQTQSALNDAWTAAGGTTPADGNTLISTNSQTLWASYTYIETEAQWVYRGQDSTQVATNITLGIVKGVASGNGKIYIESDGTMSLLGYDALNTAINAKQATIPAGTSGNLISYSGTAGTIGSVAPSTFATSAQGTKADNALPANNVALAATEDAITDTCEFSSSFKVRKVGS